MRKLKLLLVTLALLVGGALSAWADTAKLLGTDGWTKITTIPTAEDIANNYYVFVDNSNDLMLGIAKGVHQDTKWYSLGLYYQTSVKPTSSEMNGKTWILESQADGFAMRNLEYSVYCLQTEWGAALKWDTNDVTNPNEWAKINLAYSGGYWTIENGHDAGNYIGPWDDGSFINGAECAGNKTGDNVGKFQIYAISRNKFKQNLIDHASSSNVVDLTPWYVTNATFDANNSDGWTTSFSANASSWWGSHAFNNLGAENYQQVADVNQTLTLPNGQYKVALQGASSKASENKSYVYATHNGSTVKEFFTQSTTSSIDGTKWSDMQYNLLLMMQDRSYAQVLTPEVTVTTGSLTIGYKNEGGWSWDVYDNFKLYYIGQTISTTAVALPISGDMEADTWYYIDIATAADNYNATGTLANIVYTTDGTILLENAASVNSTFSATGNSLEAVRYYVKSDIANNLSIEAASFTYEVTGCTPSVADESYVKSTDITITFTASDNDPDAEFEVLDNSKVKVNGTAVNPTLDGTALTISLGATLAQNQDYTITIEAGAVGYKVGDEVKASNTQVTYTYHTALFADGDYYLKNKDNDAYFAGGLLWGTQAITNDRGHIVNLTSMSDGKYTINTYLSNGGDSHYLNGLYCDGASTEWTFTANGDYYTISNGDGKLTAGASDEALTLTSGTGDNTKWQLVTAANWKAEKVALLDAATATNGVDATFYIAAPDFNRNDPDANNLWQGAPGISGLDGNGVNANFNGQKFNTTPFDVYQELTGLKPGAYKVEMKGFYRNGTTDDKNAILYANGYKQEIANIRSANITAKDDSKGFTTSNGDFFVPNTQAEAAKTFNNGYYSNELNFLVEDDGALRIGVKKDDGAENDWAVFDEFRLTYYGELSYTALQTAYDAVVVPTLGFESGEYAPYKNAVALQALAKAKDMLDNKTAVTQAEIDAAKNAIETISWNVNTTDMSAILWKTDYTADDKAVDGYVHPIGWTNTGYHTRIMCAANDAESNPAMTTIGTAVFSKFNTTYGEQVGYTMPLKAGQLYKISFNYCGWGNTPTTNVVIKRPNGTSVTVENASFKPATNDGNSNAAHWYEYTGSFTADVAGDYVLELNKVESGQQQIAWADMQLVKTQEVSANMTITDAKYATFIAPFDVTIPEGVAAYKVLAAEGKTLTLDPVETTIPANTPVVLYKDVTGADFTQDFNSADRSTKNTYTVGLLTGVYADTPATPNTYVLQNQSGTVAFYKVESGNEPTVGKNRAYVNAGAFGGAEIKAFYFDEDETTAIESLDVLTSCEYDAIYNAAGIQVDALQKGLNIVVKDGKSYKIYVK